MAWETPLGLLREEIHARREEGCVIPDDLVARIRALEPERDAEMTGGRGFLRW